MRRIAVALGLGVAGVGIWLITKEHGLGSACNPGASSSSIGGLNSSCMSAISSYFIGFAMVSSGLIIFALAIFLMTKSHHAERGQSQQTPISTLHREDESFRDAA
jgi:hypothetical protein